MAHDAYITSEFYSGTYKGTAIDAADFDRIALRASEEIDSLTMNQIRNAGGLATFSEADQERIQLATSAVAEWLNQENAVSGGSGVTPSSEKVGSYSYTVDAAEFTRARRYAFKRAGDFLLWTGLLYSGVEACER